MTVAACNTAFTFQNQEPMSEITTNEIRKRLTLFSKQWQTATSEKSHAQTFWLRFYECFGIRAESATVYEQAVNKLGGASGYIDSFIPGKLIVEHKSAGKNLESAFEQAKEYFLGLKESERPRYIITSDFKNFALHDLLKNITRHCSLAQLASKAQWFLFLIDGDPQVIQEESPVNRNAAYAVSQLHEALLQSGFKGADLESFLTRLLFCFFSDDTGVFGDNGVFRRLVEETRADGKDVGAKIAELFDVLNTPTSQRQSTLDESLAAFNYINGRLFHQRFRIPAFDSKLRELLIACATLDWSGISPAIFGAMFQGVLEAHSPDERRQVTRRQLGAHYTSERNILRVVNPLCMDSLRAEFASAKSNKNKLRLLYDKLPTLTFFDPACGCGNFLVIAFRELRRVENMVIAELFGFSQGKGLLDVTTLCRVKVSQFYGIEIDDSAAHIAQVAMWITDHQMNLEAAAMFGSTRPTVPLLDSPTIARENALRLDWSAVLHPSKCAYLLGNPPFAGKQNQTAEQKSELNDVFDSARGVGVLDYVASWYKKACDYMQLNKSVRTALVSTNSITQGEQVSALWEYLLSQGIYINFAYRSFTWSNEGKGNAAVHCVIVGFSFVPLNKCILWEEDSDPYLDSDPISPGPKRINPYLVDAPDVLLANRTTPLCDVPAIGFGSMPNDGGHLLLSEEDRMELLANEPSAKKWIRPFLGAEEFINKIPRWCLWLKAISPTELRAMPEVYKRVKAVQAQRLASPRAATRSLASTPYLFGENRQPTGDYLLVPGVSSQRRRFVPIGFLPEEVIVSNLAFAVPDATVYHFAVLCSSMHNAWMRAVCGRMKSDYRYSAKIVYNNFPWPEGLSATRMAAIESAGHAVLAARSKYPHAALADLYDPLSMPSELSRAHEEVDKAVDLAYGYRGAKTDAARVASLFYLYQSYTDKTANSIGPLHKA